MPPANADDPAAMIQSALALTREQPQEAIARYDEIVERFGNSADPDDIAQVVLALRLKAIEIVGTEGEPAALTLLDDALVTFGDRSEAVIAEQVVEAMMTKATLLKSLGRVDGEQATLQQVRDRFQTRQEQPIVNLVLTAAIHQAMPLGLSDGAAAAHELLDQALGPAHRQPPMPDVPAIAMATWLKGRYLAELGQVDAAIEQYDHILASCPDYEDPAVGEWVGMAMIARADALGDPIN